LRLVWTERSLGDRRQIYEHIEADDPRAAIAIDERIEVAARRLLVFPESGRPGRVEDTRELVVARTAIVIPYRVVGDVIRLLRVLHGAREWPEQMPDED
jgi:addiction module RelE/StbE family toxin